MSTPRTPTGTNLYCAYCQPTSGTRKVYRSTAYPPQLRGDVAASLTTISASEGLIKSLDPDFDMLRGALPYFIRYRALGGPAAREPDADTASKNAQFAQRLQLDPA